MFIEQIFPTVVAEKSTLHERLFAEAKARGLSNQDMKEIISIPNHDPVLLFRSVEKKIEPADANLRLLGVWVITEIKQNEKRYLPRLLR